MTRLVSFRVVSSTVVLDVWVNPEHVESVAEHDDRTVSIRLGSGEAHVVFGRPDGIVAQLEQAAERPPLKPAARRGA